MTRPIRSDTISEKKKEDEAIARDDSYDCSKRAVLNICLEAARLALL